VEAEKAEPELAAVEAVDPAGPQGEGIEAEPERLGGVGGGEGELRLGLEVGLDRPAEDRGAPAGAAGERQGVRGRAVPQVNPGPKPEPLGPPPPRLAVVARQPHRRTGGVEAGGEQQAALAQGPPVVEGGPEAAPGEVEPGPGGGLGGVTQAGPEIPAAQVGEAAEAVAVLRHPKLQEAARGVAEAAGQRPAGADPGSPEAKRRAGLEDPAQVEEKGLAAPLTEERGILEEERRGPKEPVRVAEGKGRRQRRQRRQEEENPGPQGVASNRSSGRAFR